MLHNVNLVLELCLHFLSDFAMVALYKSFDIFEVINHFLVSLESVSVLEWSLRSSDLFRKDLRIDGSVQRFEIGVEGDAVANAFIQKWFDDLEKNMAVYFTFMTNFCET